MSNRFRLDRTITPLIYTIELEPNLTAFTFKGQASITLRAIKPFSSVTLHASELTVTHAAIQHGAARAASTRISYHKTLETATIQFDRTFPANHELRLVLAFRGTINDKMRGFYRTSYHVNGKKRWGGATQFEATDARCAFPCWDEPDRKAIFHLTLRVPKHLTALSNMPVASSRIIPGTKLRRLTYKPTPKMSTYLLAWVIADLECVEGRDANGIPIRIWTTTGKKEQGRFALEVGRHALEYFSTWFNIPYALPKMDMVALPDFAAGAMENWGLVTYRETTLLIDPKNSSAQAKQRVAEVISHELAHQWFGNLVTMEWWTDLWLNEGFASYMDPKAVNAKFPDWQVWNQFVAGEYLLALHDDGLKNSHPIEIPVNDPHEIREIFDHITYNKGSAVNRMLEHFLTEPVFRKGLSRYLKRYAFRNARTQDLWATLEEVSGKPVQSIMTHFTKQEGYPVVIAKKVNAGSVSLEQRRFLADGSQDSSRKRWSVPIVATAQGKQKPYYSLLHGAHTTLLIPTTGWVKINASHSGFYRTAYDAELFGRLSQAIATQELSVLDCLGLLDDTFALAKAGFMKTSQALDLMNSSRGYTDYNVWSTIAGVLASVENVLNEPAWRAALKSFARELFAPLAHQFGWECRTSDGHLDALLRSLVLSQLGHFGDPSIVAEAASRFERFVKRGTLAPDIRGPVFTTAAEHGGIAAFEKLLKVYRASSLQEEKVRILRALTNVQQPDLIRRALTFAFSDEVRRQDAYMVLAGYGHNPAGRDLAWAFAKRHWKTLIERYSDGGLRMMTYMIEGSTRGFTTTEKLQEIRQFFKTHPVPGTDRTMRQSLEAIETTIRWWRRDAADVRHWLTVRAPRQLQDERTRSHRAMRLVGAS